MTKYRFVKGAILLALVLMVTVVSAATALSDLNVTKEVTSTGPYEPGDDVEWLVTVWNNGPDAASDIDVAEDISDLTDLDTMDVTPGTGTYDDATDTWTIPELLKDASAQLMVVTNFTTAGEKTNTVTIANRGQDDLVTTDNSAVMTVIINEAAPVIYDVDLKIKPTTLNLKSKGVFTVFVSVGSLSPASDESEEEESEEAGKPEIDFDESTLTCSEAELIRASVSNKDGGTLIAKFYRQDLLNVTNGTGVLINCSGTLVINGETYNVEGSDTIRVLGDKKGLAKILSDVKKFLRLENDEVEVNETENSTATATVTLNPESYKNKGQEKKINQNSVSGTNTDDTQSDTTRGPKEKEVKNTGSNKNIQENTGGDTTGRGNGNANKPAESPGQSNGKKNK